MGVCRKAHAHFSWFKEMIGAVSVDAAMNRLYDLREPC